MDDGSLIREAQGGDRAAFAQLVYAHDKAVLKLALRITGSQSEAQDIYQEGISMPPRTIGIPGTWPC